jgi:glyoxalase family protein
VRLSLVEDGGTGPRAAPNPRTDVPAPAQLQGLGYSVLSVSDPKPTQTLLERGLRLRPVREYVRKGYVARVFAMGAPSATMGPHAEVHLQVQPDGPRRRPGAGAVHHVALRVADAAELKAWAAHLTREGFAHSGVIDRYYFRSLYLQGEGGLVIELATDGPGLDVDEPLANLGERLALPPSLEGRRGAIERRLRPLTLTQGAS